MIKNGLKSLDWNSFIGIKQDLLYFDKIYFDSFTLAKYRSIREWAGKLSALGTHFMQRDLWSDKKDIFENLEIVANKLAKESPNIEDQIEDLFSKSFHSDEYKKTEADIEFLIKHKLIDTIDPHNYFSLIPNKKDKSTKNSFIVVPNLQITDINKYRELSSTLIESMFYSFGEPPEHKIPLFNKKKKSGKLKLNEQDIERWVGAQNTLLKLLTMLENEINSEYHYVPIFNQESELSSLNMKETEVLKLVLNKFPLISDETHFEQIMEFRENSENKLRLLELRRWIQSMANSDLSIPAIKEEIEYLLEKYKHELKLRKIKFIQTPLEIFVVTSLEILSDTIKLEWGKAAKKIFAISKDKVDYLIDMDKLVGKEIAYIQKVNEKFTNF